MTEGDDTTNGKDGKDGKGKRERDTQREPTRTEQFLSVRLAMEDNGVTQLPKWPFENFVTFAPELGTKLLACHGNDGVIQMCSHAHLAGRVLEYCTNYLFHNKAFDWSVRIADEYAKWWTALAEPIERPKYLAWADEDCLTWRRLPWSYQEEVSLAKECPSFCSFLNRTTNAEALVHWIGSLLDPDSYRQQYVWLRGDGQDGKSSIGEWLVRVYGQGAATQNNVPQEPNQHWTASFVHKRLVVFPDMKRSKFTVSGLFKSLSGGDRILIDRKFKEPYTTHLDAKFLFLSNIRPALTSSVSDTRRVIYCEVAPLEEDPDHLYPARLWAETRAFLSFCLAEYQRACPRGEAIRTDPTEVSDITAENEERFATLFERHFKVVEDPKDGASAATMTDFLDWAFRGPHSYQDQKDFRMYLERQHGIPKCKVVRCGDNLERRYRCSISLPLDFATR